MAKQTQEKDLGPVEGYDGIQMREVDVELTGMSPVMFDAYRGKDVQLPPERKLYLTEDGELFLPAKNMRAFLASKRTGMSCVSSFIDARKKDPYLRAVKAYVAITPGEILFLRDDKPIKFGGFNGSTVDEGTGIYVDYDKAVVGTGIPTDTERPVLPLPWSLKFRLRLVENQTVSIDTLRMWFEDGGVMVAIGNHRPDYGQFRAKLTEA